MAYEQFETLRKRLTPLHTPDGAADASGRVSAAVLVPIFDRDGELYVLFIKRSDTVGTHQGQVAFPGGRAEPADPDILTTALREAEEEVGLRPETVEVLGRLSISATFTSNYLVTPIVGDFQCAGRRPSGPAFPRAASMEPGRLDPGISGDPVWRAADLGPDPADHRGTARAALTSPARGDPGTD
jgi:8-oxo-dGTP pyrophosphatase MutT (NUDIX family)